MESSDKLYTFVLKATGLVDILRQCTEQKRIFLTMKSFIQQEIQEIKNEFLQQKLLDLLKLSEEDTREMEVNYLFIRNTVTAMVQRRFAMIYNYDFREKMGTEVVKKKWGVICIREQIMAEVYIRLDHIKRELNFLFKNFAGDTMDTDSVSSREKSFALLCLVSSLWEQMNPPFRVMVGRMFSSFYV